MMDRTALLAAIVLVVLLGCLGAGPADEGPEPSYETYAFDHAGVDAPAIEGGISYPRDGGTTRRNYVTIVASEEAAERFDPAVLDDGAESFVANTSFDDAYLVVVQEFPASSHPDYRVERIESDGDTLYVYFNDSSRGATADVTVETVLVRVHGDPLERVVVRTEQGYTFASTDGIVTRTPEPTTERSTVSLPYASENDSENVDDPRDVRIVNRGNDVNGYRIAVTYPETPECRYYTPPCGEPTTVVTVVERTGKLRPGANLTLPDVAARKGTYTIRVAAEVPAANGSRRTVTDTLEWHIGEGYGDAIVVITDEDVTVRETRERATSTEFL